MSVTRFKKRDEDLLNFYVGFLNIDLSSDPRPKLKEGQRLKRSLNQFEREFNPSTGKTAPNSHPHNWLEEAQELQREMRNDLFPIAARKGIPEKLFPLRQRWLYLTEKLNEMKFIRRWKTDENEKGQIIIKGWNYKPDWNERYNKYAGLAELLEDGDLDRLHLCPICHKYFSARGTKRRFCSKRCKVVYDNRDSKFRVQRYRERKKGNKCNEAQKIMNEKGFQNFSNFVTMAIGNSQDVNHVGPIVKELGKVRFGDSTRGWEIIGQWENQRKNGDSWEKVLEKTDTSIKKYFIETS